MYAHLKSATELQLLIAVLSLFHMFAPDIVSVLWNNCVRARTINNKRSSLYLPILKPFLCVLFDVSSPTNLFCSELEAIHVNDLILIAGLKPYMCDVCGKTYSQGASRNVHMRKSHPTVSVPTKTTPEQVAVSSTQESPSMVLLEPEENTGTIQYNGGCHLLS